MKKKIVYISLGVIIVAFINFFCFYIDTMRLGGDALNGYEKNGMYFVSDHGKITEVSREEWNKNRLLGISLFITNPMAILSMAYLLFQYAFPFCIYRQKRDALMHTVIEVKNPESFNSKIKCSGRIGALNFGGNSIKAYIYPSGLVFKPLFMNEFAIRKRELLDIGIKHGLLSVKVTINHRSKAVSSPIVLNINEKQDFYKALTKFAS